MIPAILTAPVVPDPAQAAAFFKALFPVRNGDVVHFRAVPEPKDNRSPRNCHYTLDENFDSNVRGFLEWCAVDGRAAFFLPGTVRGAGTGKADVTSLPAVLVDFDKGDPDANLKAAEALLGGATSVIESGGRTDIGPKLHAYWTLVPPASGAGDIGTCCQIREALASRFGGDPAFKQAAQVIRIPGSIHFKGSPKLVTLRSVSNAAYTLAELDKKINPIENPVSNNSNVVNFFDFNNVDVRHDVERALVAPIHEGAVDDITRFEGVGKALGHFIRMAREGHYDLAGAWSAAQDWNAATLVPPWSEERLRGDFDRLVRMDLQSHGPVVPPAAPVMATEKAEGWSITDWRSDRFSGPAPERRWLVEGLIPQGTPGVFAAVGDSGKSMLALQLALRIATCPPIDTTAAMDFSSPCFFGQPVHARGAAVILTAEDDADEVHRRLNNLDPNGLRSKRPLFVIPMLSTGGARSILVDTRDGPAPTEFWKELRTQLLAIPDLRLVVLDPLSSFVGADINKDNLAAAALMTLLAELASTSGAAIMLIHHFAKATIPTNLSDARESIRGAGALVDNGRWAIVLWEADQDDAFKILKALGQKKRSQVAGIVYFGGLAKGNAPGEKKIRTLVRNATGILVDMTEQLNATATRADELDDAVFKFLQARSMKFANWTFAIGRTVISKEIHPETQKAGISASVDAVKASIDRLVEAGLVIELKPGKFAPNMS